MIYALRLLAILLYTVLWGVPATLLAFVDRSGESVVWIGRTWIRWILATCRIRVVAEGLANVDLRRPQIFMCNHQSVLDIAALVATLPVSFRFVAKRELAWIPLFGWALAASGHIMIDRRNRERAIRSLQRAGRRIRSGLNVIVFPEGSRSPTGRLQAFKKGAFHLATAARVPVVPVTVSGSQHLTPKRSLRVESGTIRIAYGAPIPTEDLTPEDHPALMERVRAGIRAGYDPAYQGESA